jgi:hypothetical protein
MENKVLSSLEELKESLIQQYVDILCKNERNDQNLCAEADDSNKRESATGVIRGIMEEMELFSL